MSLALLSQSGIRKHLVPDSLTHSAGTITAVLGTKVYQVVLGALSANVRYQLYLVSGQTLVYSANENSVGPAGYSSWLLIGSFYANAVGGIAFGSFVNIEGKPVTSDVTFTPSSSWVNNVGFVGRWYRNGLWMQSVVKCSCSGAPGPGTFTVNMHSTFTIDVAKLNTPAAEQMQNGSATTNGVYSLFLLTNGAGNHTVAYATNTSDLLAAVTPTAPTVFGGGSEFDFEVKLPIVGWSNTPIKDL